MRISPEEFEEEIEDLHLCNEPITNHYKIGQVLGVDRNSVVKEGILLKDPDFHVAIKTINFTHMKGYYHTIIQEILALKQVDHPCIVKLIEVFKDNENIYLVMEKIEGVTLT